MCLPFSTRTTGTIDSYAGRKNSRFHHPNLKTKIKKGDLVKVISGGKDNKGKTGRVLEVIRDEDKGVRVRVEGINIIKRHIKPQKNPKFPEGGIIEGAGSIHVSNVMLMSEKLGRPVRTGAVFSADGEKKTRVARGRQLKAEAV